MNRWQAFNMMGRKKKITAAVRGKVCGRSELMAKLAVIAAALLLGATLFLICVYGILPSLISSISDKIETGLADNLYLQTMRKTDAPAASGAAVFEQPEKTAGTVKYPRGCFKSVLKDNPDIVGRVTIEGLDIAYLVTQSIDNDFYFTHGYDRTKSKSGTVFLDYRCRIDPLEGNNILYGQSMKNGSMFHELMQYADEKTFNDNRIIRFDTLYEDYEWEVFSAYMDGTDLYYTETSFDSDGGWLMYINGIQEKSIYETDVKLSADDVILTLSACGNESDNARFVVHAKLIK